MIKISRSIERIKTKQNQEARLKQEDLFEHQTQINNKLPQKVHNDSHIFFLKTADEQTSDQNIFSFCLNSTPNRQSRLRMRIKSKHDIGEFLNRKTSISSQNHSPSNEAKINFMKGPPVQRSNKKIEIREPVTSQARIELPLQQPKIYQNTTKDLKPSKKTTSVGKSNYFNVKEFMEQEEKRKNQNTVIIGRNKSNSLVKRRKKFGKQDQPVQKQKQFNFNAIDVSKGVVQKNLVSNVRVSFQANRVCLKLSKSYKQEVNQDRAKLRSLMEEYLHQRRASQSPAKKQPLQRSNSQHIPKYKDSLKNIFNQFKQPTFYQQLRKTVKNDKIDQSIDLNPWSYRREGEQSISKNRYRDLKTGRKQNDEQSQFFSYYMKTSRNQKQHNDSY